MIIEERASTHVYRQKRLFTKEELEASIGKQVFTPNFESEYLRFEKVLSK